MKKYYLHNGTEQEGPFNIAELTAKNIKKDTEIWYEGLSDWTTAEKIDELKELFKLNSPPPIKKKETSPPPPLNKQKIEKETKPKKKTTSWKSVFIKTAIACAVIFGGMAIYSEMNRGGGYDDSYNSGSYEERKMTVAEIEQSQPTKFLSADGTYRENFLGDKLEVNGTISNSATVVNYKDATVRVTYYSKTKTNLGSEDYTIWEIFPPNHTKKFQLKIKNYSNVNSIGWEVINAKVY